MKAAATTTSPDQRRFKRFAFASLARLYSSTQAFETDVIDISLRGAMVVKPLNFAAKVGSTARLELRLHGTVVISMGCSVATINAETVGLKTERLDWDSFLHLKRLIELNIGESEILNRELSNLG
jgi:PilZ domain